MPTDINTTADIFCLDPAYSTSRLVALEIPNIENPADAQFTSQLFLPIGEGRTGEGGLRTKGFFKRSIPGKPLITVITVVYNGKTYLENTIKSILNQTYDNVEYIIVDGGSNDGSVDIIRNFENNIDYWVSERDLGLYDALNKGICLAQGEVIGHLHADDVFFSHDIINEIVTIFIDKQLKELFIYSDTVYLTKEGNKLCKVVPEAKPYINIPFIHTSLFMTHQTCKKIGLYNLNYIIASDIDYVMRLLLAHIPFEICNIPICLMRDTGVSNTSYYKGRYEYAKVYHHHYHKPHLAIFGLIYTSVLRMLYESEFCKRLYRGLFK